MKDFYDLFINELKKAYDGEEQMIDALPIMAKAAQSDKLKAALKDHLAETKNQLKRLNEIAKELQEDLTGHKCIAMQSLVREGEEAIKGKYDKLVIDSAIIAAAQKIEHYEISTYGTLKAFAKYFDLKKVEDLLEETSKEEGKADKLLNTIAEGSLFSSGVNVKAFRRSA